MDILARIDGFGIGTDIESISRFRKLGRLKNNSFLNRIFTKNELDYCFSKKKAAPHLAVRYAAKEATVKALSGIGRQIIDYKDIEIFNNKMGVPIVKINNKKLKNLQANVSLSHCRDKAIAFAIVIKSKAER